MCPACWCGHMTAGPDVIRGSGPDQKRGLETPIDPSGFFPTNGSTVSHHVIITLAIGMRLSTRSLTLHRQPI
jgi:hypothetical protein